jgi:hypothetical protein
MRAMSNQTVPLQKFVEHELGGAEATVKVDGNRVTETSRDLVGLALSGGGIRSATFNLGLLQGLHHLRLLERLDYLSTVSGGGYIGSFWTAWRARQWEAKAGPAPCAGAIITPDAPAFPSGTGDDGRVEPREIRHLREFSNFLAPHLGLLSWDTGRMIVTLVSSIVPSLMTVLSVITLAVLAWCLLAFGLFATTAVGSTAVFIAATALILIGMEAAWRERREVRDLWAYAEAFTWVLVCAGVVWWLMVAWPGSQLLGWYGQRLPVPADGAQPAAWLYLLAPVVPWLVASLLMSLRRWAGSRRVAGHARRVRRNSFDRVHARFLFAAAAWIGITLLWGAGAFVWGLAERNHGVAVSTGLGGATAAVVIVFSRLQKYFSVRFKDAASAGAVMNYLQPMLPPLLAWAAIALIVVSVIAALVGFDRSDFALNPPLTAAALALIILALVVLLFNPNEIGLHTFYRARISRAYLGASNPDKTARGKTEERENDDMRLNEIHVRQPCHLVCCAANDLSSRELGNLDRGAVSAVLSPVGFSVDGEGRTWNDDPSTPTLSEAVTASAAAFNPLMGGKSKELGPAVTFLMAAFNLRLGLWVPRVEPESRLERILVGLPFLSELFGRASAGGRIVHLSDGGHFENMGVYELIRRHCRYIIASDCGMDSTVSFDDFGNLVRRVRADFGVDIRIDLSALRPNAEGTASQPMVAGDIHYPEGDTGILLLIKPTITGSEPADVAQYRTRNVVFPHETTSDQFYDEAQWESYRRLGEHAAHSAFRRVSEDLEPEDRHFVRHLFLRARREWQSVPEGFGERLSHFADRMEQLDSLLRQPECATLLREVYKEIDDLDHSALAAAGRVSTGADAASPAPPERLPDPKDLAPSLHLIRRALLLMQEAYTRENLEENYQHPLYLGLVNYFARWTTAPLFRLWWPLLKTMYPQPFTRFVERHYGLRASDTLSGEVRGPSANASGFAMSVWRQRHAVPLRCEQRVVSFMLKLTYRGQERAVQAAQVVASSANGYLAWDAEHFFVPPGLWGVGIGERFLQELRARTERSAAATAGVPPSIERLFVRIRIDPAAGGAAKKQIANEIQLYRSAGFERVSSDEVPPEVAIALGQEQERATQALPSGPAEVAWMATPILLGEATENGALAVTVKT